MCQYANVPIKKILSPLAHYLIGTLAYYLIGILAHYLIGTLFILHLAPGIFQGYCAVED